MLLVLFPDHAVWFGNETVSIHVVVNSLNNKDIALLSTSCCVH